MVVLLMVCSFLGVNEYECNESSSFDNFMECELLANNLTESKGVYAYCKLEDEDDRD